MSIDPSRLQVEFSTEAALRSEYVSNIANGGVFIATSDAMEPRTPVVVVLELSFCNQYLELEGEVVHCIPPEMAEAGASPGVAIQFGLPARELRKQFEPFVGVIEGNERLSRSGRRAAPRSSARLHVHVRSESIGAFDCRTRDVSSSGMLLSISGHEVPVGERVKLTIRHPQTAEAMDVDGTVVRHLTNDEEDVTALGVEFHIIEARQTEVTAFISDVQSAEHSRRLGGINGPIAELGIENLLQMFGTSSPQGTLNVTRGAEEGTIVFADGCLRAARQGEKRSIDALEQMLSWREGVFEFQARLDEADFDGEPIPLGEAIQDALGGVDQPLRDHAEAALEELSIDLDDLDEDLGLDFDDDEILVEDVVPDADADAGVEEEGDLDRQMRTPAAGKKKTRESAAQTKKPSIGKNAQESSRSEPDAEVVIGPTTTFAVDASAGDAARAELGKTEEAVLDLALVGMSVDRMLGVIPEPESEIHAAVDTLVERGLITIK